MLDDPGMVRILDNLEQGIREVRADISHLDIKLDGYVERTVTKEEFDAYQELRRTTVRWAVGTIVSVMMLIATAIMIIINTRPDILS